MIWRPLRQGVLCVTLTALTLSACTSTGWLERTDKTGSMSGEWDADPFKNGSVEKSETLTSAEQALYDKQYWQLSGRLSITSEKGAWSGALRWRQNSKKFVLSLNAPLGQGALQIKGDDISVELNTADGRSLMADDVDSLFEKEIGWALPVSGLRYWLFGIPSPESSATILRDQQSIISEIKQLQWKIAIKRYQTVGEIQLPKKLELNNRDFNIRLIIDHWDMETKPFQMVRIRQNQIPLLPARVLPFTVLSNVTLS